MRHFRYIAFACMCIFIFSISGESTARAAAQYKLTFSTHSTPDSFQGVLQKAFLDEVERLTEGRVTFQIFWGASLLNGEEVLNAVNTGIVDSGMVNINFFAKQLPFSNLLNTIQESPGSYSAMLTFFNRAFAEQPELKQELAKFNHEVMSVYAVMDWMIISNKPMTKIGDLKGLKCRSASRWHLPLFTELGSTPVSVPWGDCTMALQTNVIDAVFSNLDAINMVKMEDAAPNGLIFQGFTPSTPYLLTINSKKFNAMPEDIKAKFREAAVSAQKSMEAEYNKWMSSIRASQQKAGYKIVAASTEDLEIWKNLKGIEGNKQIWLTEAKAAGISNAQEYLDSIYALFNQTRVPVK